jgi:hypothetical protein
MPTYGKDNFKESNVNYLNKDFASLKQSLMNYAKSYFPNTYRDFNETSPGMMLLEMNAYVGDVLSFYIDQQYREMLLPLAEERRNIITMAKMFGYKVKPIIPSYVDLTFTSEVDASSGDASKVDYSKGGIFNPGIEIQSSTNTDVIFTTLEHIDFQISESNDTDTIGSSLTSGLASSYTLERTVKAVSATEKTISFQVKSPEKFKKLTIPDTNVIDIISCVDSNNQNWYEVDFLAQDKVSIETHYTEDRNRDNAYVDDMGLVSSTATPFSLQYIKTSKRFTRETNEDNTTSLVFGNGVLKNGQVIDDGFIDLEQVGIVIPGQTNDLDDFIDAQLGDVYSTLGETPNQTTLTITYRVGGGINSNVPSDSITNKPTQLANAGNTSATLSSTTNRLPARGGKDSEDTIEIKEKAKAFFATQNRCVTKEDYEARVLNIPAKFGNIAKAYVTNLTTTGNQNLITDIEYYNRYSQQVQNGQVNGFPTGFAQINNVLNRIKSYLNDEGVDVRTRLSRVDSDLFGSLVNPTPYDNIEGLVSLANEDFNRLQNVISNEVIDFPLTQIYVLGYNNNKELVGNNHTDSTGTTDNLPNTLLTNISKYLDNFKIMTDNIILEDGYIVNFGVFFDVIAEKYADKQKVKIDCIQKIKDYFRIEKMQFNQPIYKGQLEFELMGIEGVRSIGHVTITQEGDYFYEYINDSSLDVPTPFTNPCYSYTFNPDLGDNGDYEQTGTAGFGFKYEFSLAQSTDNTIILPPNTSTPAVFELKNPNTYIQGRVR